MSAEWPQEHELRAMPLLERLEHARRAALLEDKESIELAVDRIRTLETALERIARTTKDYDELSQLGVIHKISREVLP
jgi:hypothetical protein